MNSKNIIFHVTKKYMKLNRRRTTIAFIGIVFMVILMTCVFAGKRTVMDYLESVAALEKGSWHLAAYDLSHDEAKQFSDMENIDSIGFSKPFGYLDFPQTGNSAEKPFLDVKAYSKESFEMMNIRLTEGRLPANGSEIVISESAVKDGASVKLGDRIGGEFFDRTLTGIMPNCTRAFPFYAIEIHYGETIPAPAGFIAYEENDVYREDKVPNGRTGEYTIVGIMAVPSFERMSSAGYPALCGMDSAVAAEENINALIRLDPEKADIFIEHIADLEAEGAAPEIEYNQLVLMFSAMSGDETINRLVIFLEVFFTVFIMAASVILIYNVFNMSFAERARYLGMLSSVGATRRQKRQSIFYECFALLLPALPIGILAGLGVVKGGMELLRPHLCELISNIQFGLGNDIPVRLSTGLTEICLIVGMCAVTVLISALIPAIKISRIGPVESIRGNTEKAKKKRFGTRLRLLERGKPEMLLAVNGTSRKKHLTKSIVRSIAVFAVLTMVTLYGSQSIIKISSLMTDDSGWITEMEGYDYIIGVDTDTPNHDMVMDILAEEKCVKEVKEICADNFGFHVDRSTIKDEYFTAYREIFDQFEGNNDEKWQRLLDLIQDSTNINPIIVDDEEYKLLASKGDADMSIAGDPSVPSMLLYDQMFFSTRQYWSEGRCKGYKHIEINHFFNAEKGGEIICNGYNSEKDESASVPITVAGFVDEQSIGDRFRIVADSCYVFLNRAAYEKLSAEMDRRSNSVILFSADKENDQSLIKTLSELSEASMDSDNAFIIMEYDRRDTAGNIRQVISEMIKILAYCFTALISMVCLLNLYNSIRGRTAERTKETAMLRSVGITDRQLTKMHDLENILLFGKGVAIAAVVCTILILVLNHFIVDFFGTVSLPVPVLLAVCIAAAIFAASSIITRICSRSTDNSDIIEKIRRETV